MDNSYFWNKKIIVSYCLSIFVFWVHCSSFANYNNGNAIVQFCSFLFCHTINAIAVPLFFVLSGITFYRDYTDRKYVKKLFSRIKSLVIPFLLWNIINMVFNMFASTFFSQYFIGREKMVISFQNIFLGIFHYKYNGPFWFVFALIIFTIAAPIIDKLLYSQVTALLSIAVLLGLYYFDIGLPQPLFFSKTCIIFYLVGGYIGRFHFSFFARPHPRKYQMLSMGVIIVAIIYYMLLNYGVIHQEKTVANIMLITFSVCFWNMIDLFLPTQITTVPSFMNHSFWIFALHINLSAVITKLVYFILPKNPYMSLANFAITTLTTLLCIEIACSLVKKLAPLTYALLSGSR